MEVEEEGWGGRGGEDRLLGKKRLLGLSGRSSVSVLGCCGMFSMSGSSVQKNGLATLVPSNNLLVSRLPSSDTVVCVVTSRRGDSALISLQCTT